MSSNIFKRKPFLLLYAAGTLLLGIAACISWNTMNSKPEQVFWGMMHQSLATSGVTVQSHQENAASTVKQTVQFSLGGQNISRSLTTLTQPGTTVDDEVISTTDAAYTRYTNVKTDQKRPDGKPMDFSSINGVWAKSDGDAGRRLLGQDILGTGMPLGGVAIPIANLSPASREKLVHQIKSDGVYRTSFAAAKKERQGGRTVYVYTVAVKPVKYADMMKSLAKAAGLHDLDSLDSQTFAGKEDFELMLTVDVRSRHLVSAEAVGADIKQIYSSYDVPVSVAMPAKTITAEELKKRLNAIQR